MKVKARISKRILESGNIITLVCPYKHDQAIEDKKDFDKVLDEIYYQRDIQRDIEYYYKQMENGDRILYMGIMPIKKGRYRGDKNG
jgi:hypothetical protein